MSLPTAFNPEVTNTLKALDIASIDRVFFVACGGSLAIMQPAKVLFDQYSALGSDAYNAAEFVALAPKTLTQRSLVVLCSTTGTTKETTAAATFAAGKGATTIAFTNDPQSPLGQASSHVVSFDAHYTTGTPIDSKNSNYSRIYQLIIGFVALSGGPDLCQSLIDSVNALQPAIDRAIQSWGPTLDDYASRLAKKEVIYTMASGADYGAAYSYAICVLMEMQWINSHPIHANEFFHGAFEVVDQQSAFILLKGLDNTRPLEERAGTFLERFASSDNVLVLDAKELDLSGIDERFQGSLVPLIFFDTLWKFAYTMADLRHHRMLEDRRYMKKIDY